MVKIQQLSYAVLQLQAEQVLHGGSIERAGGGIYIYNSSPTIINNIIEYNHIIATGNVAGSAILIVPHYNSTTIIENNIIRNNIAQSTGSNTAINGTILIMWAEGTVIIRGNIISDNALIPSATNLYCNGGGISAFGNDYPDFLCIIENNIIQYNEVIPEGQTPIGGGIFMEALNAVVRNNIIAYNSARIGGGFQYWNPYSNVVHPVLENNTIFGNTATVGGGLSTHHFYEIVNCIIWGNSSPQYNGATATIDYSTLEENYPTGSNNSYDNPQFEDTIYFCLDNLSPCVDEGNPDPMYNDVEDPNNLGYALYPAMGTLKNDMGVYGGPNSTWASLLSDTLYVPEDYSTIQSAIDAANNGDVVLVADGLYYENINYKGKAITVASHFLVDGDSTHIENTIIDGSQPSHPDSGSVVYFASGEDTTSVLCGFTITGGTGTYEPYWDDKDGGGIYLDSSGAKIINNIIKSNSIVFNGFAFGAGIMAFSYGNHNVIIRNNLIDNNYLEGTDTYGAGIALFTDSYSLVSNNRILNNVHNSAYCQGGGIHMGPGNHQIINNYIFNNSALSQASSGGGAGGIYTISYANMDDEPVIANNLIIHNEGTEGGGIKVWTLTESSNEGIRKNKGEKINTIEQITYNPIIENNSILFNTSPGFGGGIRNGNNTPTQIINNLVWGNDGYLTYDQIYGTSQIVTYCNVQGGFGGEGNIDEDPMFDDTTYYCINQNSPCIDAGNPDVMYNDIEDPNNPGYALLPARGTLINDMGCFGGPNSQWSMWDIPVSVKNDGTEDEIPTEFTFSQNYPNPFNPATTIKYGIPERAVVELKVYDILGREVAVLINNEQDAGYYEINFNASKLSSGVYLYQLKAGQFIETRKMLLLK